MWIAKQKPKDKLAIQLDSQPPLYLNIYRKEIIMEKAFAYVCTASNVAPRLLKRYCRKIYELGYVPICPKLSDSQYLALENADEKREFQNIARQKLGRCRMLVVCGKEISNSMSAEIGMAEKRNLICTTLDGLAKIKEADENDSL